MRLLDDYVADFRKEIGKSPEEGALSLLSFTHSIQAFASIPDVAKAFSLAKQAISLQGGEKCWKPEEIEAAKIAQSALNL